ncbi:hypothetical protein [Escherichia coli]|uniref:hypothetical protein n=1 Tax=Escherichia coli TaxID=562 RepID=UPI001FCEE6FE|nr:hypothetical protein [Escherichia coli]
MSVLLTEPTQQANDKVFKTAHVAFSVVTGTGRYVTGLKQFRDANPELCTEVSDQKAWAIHPSVIQVTPGFNSREMGMGDDYYKLPEVEEPRQPGGCKLKTAPVRPVVAARPAEYVCSEDLFY